MKLLFSASSRSLVTVAMNLHRCFAISLLDSPPLCLKSWKPGPRCNGPGGSRPCRSTLSHARQRRVAARAPRVLLKAPVSCPQRCPPRATHAAPATGSAEPQHCGISPADNALLQLHHGHPRASPGSSSRRLYNTVSTMLVGH